MAEELNTATTQPAGEGQEAPPSGTPLPTEAQPSEQEPQYLTRDEALQIVDEALTRQRQAYETAAREMGQRGAQSFIDRRRLEERMKSVESSITAMVEDGLIDSSQASTYRERARNQALIDLLPEAEEPQPQGGGQTAADPLTQRAEQLLAESGLTPQDPEYHTLYGHADPFAWHAALEKAKAAKEARLARAQGAQNAAQPGPASSRPAQGAPTGAAAVEAGAGGAGGAADLAGLRKQMQAASRRGDLQEAQRIGEEIERLIREAAK